MERPVLGVSSNMDSVASDTPGHDLAKIGNCCDSRKSIKGSFLGVPLGNVRFQMDYCICELSVWILNCGSKSGYLHVLTSANEIEQESIPSSVA